MQRDAPFIDPPFNEGSAENTRQLLNNATFARAVKKATIIQRNDSLGGDRCDRIVTSSGLNGLRNQFVVNLFRDFIDNDNRSDDIYHPHPPPCPFSPHAHVLLFRLSLLPFLPANPIDGFH